MEEQSRRVRRGLDWGDVSGLLAALFHAGVILVTLGLLVYGLVVLLADWVGWL